MKMVGHGNGALLSCPQVEKCYHFLVHGCVASHFGMIVWKLRILKKIKIFSFDNQILAVEMLIKKGMRMIDQYPLCSDLGDTTDHLILGCIYAKVF